MIDVNLLDQRRGNRLFIDSTGAAQVFSRSSPAFGEVDTFVIHRQLFANSAGATDMRVVGSLASPVVFSIDALNNNDLYIATISFRIADGNASLNQFGALTALTNGIRFSYRIRVGAETIIHPNLRTNFDVIRLAQGAPSFGDGITAFRANNSSGVTSETYFPSLDLRKVFGLAWGIRLRANTTQRIALEVRDDLTGLDAFDCVVYGFQRFPDVEGI